MNASLLHHPIIMIAKTGTPPRYIAIASPDGMECVPISCFLMQSFVPPIATTASWRACSTILLVAWDIQLFHQMADTGVVGDAPLYLLIRSTIAVHWMTGQRTSLPVFHWVMVSSLHLFFCMMNVMETLLAVLRAEANKWGISLLSL